MKVFYELLMITFSTKKEHYEEMKRNYNQMLSINEAELFDDLERKMGMLVEELSCYIEITDDLAACLLYTSPSPRDS